MKSKKELKIKAISTMLCLLLLTAMLVSANMKFGTDSSGNTYSTTYGDTADFVVYKVGSTYYSKNSSSGLITSNSNATIIIQGCIDTIDADNDGEGGMVFIREGNYIINYKIIPTGNLTIRGTGKGTVLYAAKNVDIIYFLGNVFPNDRGFHIDKICFKSDSGTHTSKSGIYLDRVHHFSITNCWFDDIYDGVKLYSSTGDVDNGWIFGNHFFKVSNFCIYATSNCEENSIIGNIIDNYGGNTGIRYSGSHSTIMGNTIEEVWNTGTGSGVGDGMYITGNENTVTGNTIRENGRYNIVVGGNRNIISNNIIDDCYGSRGVSVEGNGHRITNNVVVNNNNYGIFIISGSGSSITGNVLTGHVDEIYISGGTADITNNIIDNEYHFNIQTANATGNFRAGFAWYELATHTLHIFEGAGVWKSTTFT